MKLPFVKMHGLGNDFCVTDSCQEPFSLSSNQIQQLSDRYTGIGFDQLLLLESSDDPKVDFIYRIFNADGQEVGQCGNGARCVARYIQHRGLSKKECLIVKTKQQDKMMLKLKGDNVLVQLDEPKLLAKQMTLTSTDIVCTQIDVGNPHAVIRVDEVETAPVTNLGPLMQNLFEDGVNVGFMQIIDRENIRLRVYERGAGETKACGSGACAAMVAARWQDLVDTQVWVEMPGGKLQISWDNKEIEMTGPAQIVYEGVVEV